MWACLRERKTVVAICGAGALLLSPGLALPIAIIAAALILGTAHVQHACLRDIPSAAQHHAIRTAAEFAAHKHVGVQDYASN